MTEVTASKISHRAMYAAVDMEIHAALGTMTKDKAAAIHKHFEDYDLISAQNEWLKDRLSNLQLPATSQKNIEEWLVECGMPSATA